MSQDRPPSMVLYISCCFALSLRWSSRPKQENGVHLTRWKLATRSSMDFRQKIVRTTWPEYEDKHDLRCDGHKSHWGFGSIHQDFFVWSHYYKSKTWISFQGHLSLRHASKRFLSLLTTLSSEVPLCCTSLNTSTLFVIYAEAYLDSGEDLRKRF